MTSQTKMMGAILILALGLGGVSGCLGLGKEEGDSGFSGTWAGVGSDEVTISGGCGGPGVRPLPTSLILDLHQGGSTVTGTASADGHSLTLLNGAVDDTASLNFDLDIQDAQCSQQANHFSCGISFGDKDAMWCLHTETHCDSCSGTYLPHTVQKTFDLTRQ